MNREIKFRIWDKIKNQWNPYTEITQVGNLNIAEDNWQIPMQYTGLKDKNGKEIYEGDIIKGFDFTAKVYWNIYQASFQIKTSNNGGAFLNEEYMSNFEIVGNIFENPELLKMI
jgi:uncharacterized phage protein (TIGR01671 family)